MTKRNAITVTPTEANVLSDLRRVIQPGEEINPNYLYPRRAPKDRIRRRAVKELARKGVLLHHPAVDDHFDIFALGGNENIKISGEYDPEKIRRAVRLENSGAVEKSGQAHFVTKSWTETSEDGDHRLTIDIETGVVFCDCQDFRFRHSKKNPTIWSPDEEICKHLRRGRANLDRRGLLPKREKGELPPCIRCHSHDAEKYFEICDDKGRVIPGQFICVSCAPAQAEESALIEESPDEREARLEAMCEVEHPPCPFCQYPTEDVEVESGAGLRTVRICLDCGHIKDEVLP